MTVDILLATYNGEQYLREQLDSILAQTNQDWRLIIRDDGSKDQTAALIHEYAGKINKKFGEGKCVVLPAATREGADAAIQPAKRITHNFSVLMEWSKKDGKAEYVMFADQDDIWHDNKIEKSLAAIKELETKNGRDIPLLVFTDATIFREGHLEEGRSFKKLEHFDAEKYSFRSNLVYCAGQGCTLIMNSALIAIASPVPKAVRLHDAWVGLLADSTGSAGYLPEATLNYRWHDNNASTGRGSIVKKAKLTLVYMDECATQAETLYSLFADKMHPDKRKDLEEFLHITKEPRAKRALHLLQGGFTRPGMIENVFILGGHRGRER